MLTQEDPDGSWPVAYASRTLREAKSRYSTTEKEALAVVWAVDHFKSYIMENSFTVVKDHAPLKALCTKANLEGRLMRFAEKLAVYNYDIIYRPGKENTMANLLSRALTAMNPNQVFPTSEQKEAAQKNRIFIDLSHRLQAVRDAHMRFGGHFRWDKLTHMVKNRFFWYGMDKEIKQVLQECVQCSQFSPRTQRYPLRSMKSSYQFKKVAMDTGQVTTNSRQVEYFFVAVNMFTKWVEVQTSTTKTGLKIAQFIEEQLLMMHGCPEIILSDRGTPYTSQEVRNMCAKWNITHLHSVPYHPESNKLAERSIGTLKRAMERIGGESQTKWRTHLAYAIFAYRIVTHRTTGFSPFKMLYGQKAIISEEVGLSRFTNWESYDKALESHTHLMWGLHSIARTRGLRPEKNGRQHGIKRTATK